MNSSGKIGEELAEIYFKSIGWVMDRHVPETKTIRIKGKPVVINCKSSGVPDYTGYELVQIHEAKYPIFRACEVKESYADTLPCSRLGTNGPPLSAKEGYSQNFWFSQTDPRVGFVCVIWMNHSAAVEIFKWKPKGSYKRGVNRAY